MSRRTSGAHSSDLISDPKYSRVVEGLDADAIARQQQSAGPCVPDRQPEHAAQPGDGR
jgi:hypothetical protein